MFTNIVRLVAFPLVVGLIACTSTQPQNDSGKNNSADSGMSDAVSETAGLYPCPTKGAACDAHDPCAITPICGDDLFCRPQGFQNCDDGLACTDDTCGALAGECKHSPRDGSCVISVKNQDGTSEVKCFAKNDANPNDPCLACHPELNAMVWSPKTGGPCDDGDTCTRDDYCNNGKCVGTDYRETCSDGLTCTEDVCDGKGGCLSHTLQTGSCLISEQCYAAGQTDSEKCNECDPSKDPNAWTPITLHCLIDDQCYQPGEKDWTGCGECDPTADPHHWTVKGNNCLIGGYCSKPGDADWSGCGVCDPTKTKLDWTPLTDSCLIDGKCYKAGETNVTGCGVCDPTKAGTDWTAVAGKCVIAGQCYDDKSTVASGCLACSVSKNPNQWTSTTGTVSNESFESGIPSGWTVQNSTTTVGWTVHSGKATLGSKALYYGDPATGSFQTSAANKGTITLPSMTIGAGKKAGVRFALYMDTEDSINYDKLDIVVKEGANSSYVWQKAYNTPMKAWHEVAINLAPYAGKTITIQIVFDTKDDSDNTGEGVYLDELTIYNDC